MAPTRENFVQYNDQNILSEDSAKALPRTERLETITKQMKQVGFSHTRVSYLFDKYSSTVLGIFENQYQLMKEHKTLLDNHKDVMSFLMANQGKSKSELQQEIERFDQLVKLERDKIAPKIKAYEKASDKIWRENAKLTAQIAVQALELSLFIYQASQTDEGVGELLMVNMLEMMFAANKLNQPAKLAKIRLHLAKLANDFIEDEQAIIDISKRLQEYQDEQ
ncbi:MAG: hypothetical protein HWE10_07745 [Gammaproteobacteria bacterium]|nr:hypothetical protein [Gammaproteobacteria bacterium]